MLLQQMIGSLMAVHMYEQYYGSDLGSVICHLTYGH